MHKIESRIMTTSVENMTFFLTSTKFHPIWGIFKSVLLLSNLNLTVSASIHPRPLIFPSSLLFCKQLESQTNSQDWRFVYNNFLLRTDTSPKSLRFIIACFNAPTPGNINLLRFFYISSIRRKSLLLRLFCEAY